MKHFAKTFIAGILLFVGMTQSSCKKSDPAPAPVPLDVAATLQNKNWKLTALVVSPAMGGVTDIYNDFYEACDRDNLFRFNPNNAFLLDEGAAKCDPMSPQTRPGTWSYNTANKTISYQIGTLGASDNYQLVVTSITETSLIGTETEVIGGVTYITTWTFAKQ